MRLGVIYSGERLDPRVFRALQHVIPKKVEMEISQVVDASVYEDDSARVKQFAEFLHLVPEKPARPDFSAVDALIVEVGSEAREAFELKNLITEAIHTGKHLLLPYNALSQLAFEEAIDVFKLAEANKVVLLGCSRFLFGQCYTRLRERVRAMEFGGFQDGLFRSGIGPALESELLTFGLHQLNLLFDLQPQLPEEITVTAGATESFTQPCISFALRFKKGVATFFLTANRLWGSNYHLIEISGAGSYVTTDLITWKFETATATEISTINDDDQGTVIFGSSGKLSVFFAAAAAARAEGIATTTISEFAKITQRSLWVFHKLQSTLADMASKGTRTGVISTDDAPDWLI